MAFFFLVRSLPALIAAVCACMFSMQLRGGDSVSVLGAGRGAGVRGHQLFEPQPDAEPRAAGRHARARHRGRVGPLRERAGPNARGGAHRPGDVAARRERVANLLGRPGLAQAAGVRRGEHALGL